MLPSESLQSLGIKIPPAPKALATYIPSKRVGSLVFTSGQLPLVDGALTKKGHLGKDLTVEEGAKEAETCILNALASLLTQISSLDEVSEIVKLGVYVASTPDFTEQHLVANGASNLIGQIFGDLGKHARFAVGVVSLPLGAAVEIEMIVSVK